MSISKNKKCPNAVILLLCSIFLAEIIYRSYQYIKIFKQYTVFRDIDSIAANQIYMYLQTTLLYSVLSVLTISFIVFAIFKFSKNFSYSLIIFTFNGLSNTANAFLYIKLDSSYVDSAALSYGLIALMLSTCFFIPSIKNYLFKDEKN